MLTRVTDNISMCNLDKGDLLREVTVKVGLERIDVINLFLRVGNKNNSCIRETQENSIENSSTN